MVGGLESVFHQAFRRILNFENHWPKSDEDIFLKYNKISVGSAGHNFVLTASLYSFGYKHSHVYITTK